MTFCQDFWQENSQNLKKVATPKSLHFELLLLQSAQRGNIYWVLEQDLEKLLESTLRWKNEGPRLIPTWIIRIPGPFSLREITSKSLHVNSCPLDLKFVYWKDFHLVLLFRIKWEVPALGLGDTPFQSAPECRHV